MHTRGVWGMGYGASGQAALRARALETPADQRAHAHAHIHTRAHAHTHAHTRTHAHTHTHTHARTQAHRRRRVGEGRLWGGRGRAAFAPPPTLLESVGCPCGTQGRRVLVGRETGRQGGMGGAEQHLDLAVYVAEKVDIADGGRAAVFDQQRQHVRLHRVPLLDHLNDGVQRSVRPAAPPTSLTICLTTAHGPVTPPARVGVGGRGSVRGRVRRLCRVGACAAQRLRVWRVQRSAYGVPLRLASAVSLRLSCGRGQRSAYALARLSCPSALCRLCRVAGGK